MDLLSSSEQRRASDPRSSIWVEASAGSGKTKVLIDRLLRLLVSGVAPEKILCLTFTKAAAAEMYQRLEEKLLEWSTASQSELITHLKVLIETEPSVDQQNSARHLLTHLYVHGRNISIETLHAFCQRLLQTFPFEAGLMPGFDVVEDGQEYQMLTSAFEQVCQTQGALVRPLIAAGFSPAALVSQCMRLKRSHKLMALLMQENGIAKIQENIQAQLPFHDLNPRASLTAQRQYALGYWATILQNQGSTKDKDLSSYLIQWSQGDIGFFTYCEVFFTRQKARRSRLCSAKIEAAYPDLVPFLEEERGFLEAVLEDQAHQQIHIVTQSFLSLAHQVFINFQHKMQSQNRVCYDDLISKTSDLLQNSTLKEWVRFKLEGWMDHVLVDEAQDTNAIQWDVIQTLVEGFFETTRRNQSLFVVGDRKQSIYQFQGADPHGFIQYKSFFKQMFQIQKSAFQEVSLERSFRSAPAVLSFVDQIFAHPAIKDQVLMEPGDVRHESARSHIQGSVTVWSLVEGDEKEESVPWVPHTEKSNTQTTAQKLAQKIAKKIRCLLEQSHWCAARGRPVEPRDFMILFRRRSHLMQAVIQALQQYNIPVSGLDRLALQDTLVVQDLLTVARVARLPLDDLQMATFLKGPFVSLSEEDIYTLCRQAHTQACSLWTVLQHQETCNPKFTQAVDFIKILCTLPMTPFSFFSQVVTLLGGRVCLRQHFGSSCDEILEAFLNQCESFQRDIQGEMEEFLEWVTQNMQEIKREKGFQNHNEVQVMTIHAAKGLQAPIVFLPDTMPFQTPYSSVLLGSNYVCLLPSGIYKSAALQILEHIQKSPEDAEQWRLWYVALTRAEDALYIGGIQATQARKEDLYWYQSARYVAEYKATSQWDADIEEEVYVYQDSLDHTLGEIEHISQDKRTSSGEKFQEVFETAFLSKENREIFFSKAVQHPILYTLQYPSQSGTIILESTGRVLEKKEGFSKNMNKMSAAERGSLIHKLLEKIPYPAEEETIIHLAKSYLQSIQVPREEISTLCSHVVQCLKNPHLQTLFQGNALKEVSCGALKDSTFYLGQIDRLWIKPTEKILWIIDYKTASYPPLCVPEAYREQLRLYSKILSLIYPAYDPQAYILWTATGDLRPVDMD